MTFTNYQYYPTVPYGPNYPGDDQPLMQTNTANIAGIFAQDHVGFNTANGGIHTVVHFQTQTFIPPQTNPATGEMYTGVPSGDTDAQLFYKSPNNVITQLTSSIQDDSLDGYVTLPGGIILQWGTKTNSGSSGTVTFSTPYPNNCFNIQLTPLTGSANRPCSVLSYNAIDFTYLINSGDAGASMFWFAIGN
jgi:hypothetical protein